MKFTTPVSMEVTMEQFNKLSNELFHLGYKLSPNHRALFGETILTTNVAGEIMSFGLNGARAKVDFGRYYIDHYNPDLFLALAAMNNSHAGIMGECWIKVNNGELQKQLIEDMSGNYSIGSYRKATKGEIIAHFTKKKEFVLPEKWAVKRTFENYQVINAWCNGNLLVDEPEALYRSNWGFIHSHSVGVQAQVRVMDHLHTNHTEITYEQFLQHVLKQPDSVVDFRKGDTVRCDLPVDGLVYGRYYKVLNVYPNGDINVEDSYGHHCRYSSIHFQLYCKEKQQSMEKKFKVGGKARFTGASSVYFTTNREYLVEGLENNHPVLTDDKGGRSGRDTLFFEPVEGKKIVGYKLKNNNYLDAAMSLTGTTMYREQFIKYLANQEKENSSGAYVGMLREAGVLDLWFEPIYEAEKPKEIKLQIGRPVQKLLITKNEVKGPDGKIDVSGLYGLRNRLADLHGLSLGSYPISITSIKIGCSYFTVDEIHSVINSYESLQ